MDNQKLLGKIIKSFRQIDGLSQSEFANHLNVNQSTVSRIEKGQLSASDLVSDYLSKFGITLENKSTKIKQHFQGILDACLENKPEKVKEYFESIQLLGLLNINEMFLSKFAEIFYLANLDRYKELIEVANFLEQFEFVFEGQNRIFYHMAIAYRAMHQQQHQQSVIEFQRAFEIMLELGLEIPVLIIVYALNNIIIRRFAIGAIYLNKALAITEKYPESYGYYTIQKHIGTLHVLNGSFHEAIAPLETFYNHKKYLESTYYFRTQIESFLGYSYFHSGNREKAQQYFNKMIESPSSVESLVESGYYYTFYNLREHLKDRDKYDHYFNKLKQLKIYQQDTLQKLHHYFFEFEGENLEAFIKDYNFMYDEIFKHSHKYLLTRTIFSIFGEDIWKKRAHSVYKSMFDIMINAKFGSFDYEL